MIIEKSWGYEEPVYNGEYCCKLLVYTKPGVASSLHYHEKKTETFVVTSGIFDIEIDGKLHQACDAGWHCTLRPGSSHRIRCIRRGVIVESSTHDDQADCVRLEPSES